MVLKVVDGEEFKDIPIKEGDIFLLPSNTPHSPQRFENTVGLVIEQKRRPEHIDKLRWYCDRCR
jgi:3-hydroxyanthranilate 3,4-dioxygenase